MDCMICPKRRLCSGADCYYDYRPEPDRELAEDMFREDLVIEARVAAAERRCAE